MDLNEFNDSTNAVKAENSIQTKSTLMHQWNESKTELIFNDRQCY